MRQQKHSPGQDMQQFMEREYSRCFRVWIIYFIATASENWQKELRGTQVLHLTFYFVHWDQTLEMCWKDLKSNNVCAGSRSMVLAWMCFASVISKTKASSEIAYFTPNQNTPSYIWRGRKYVIVEEQHIRLYPRSQNSRLSIRSR